MGDVIEGEPARGGRVHLRVTVAYRQRTAVGSEGQRRQENVALTAVEQPGAGIDLANRLPRVRVHEDDGPLVLECDLAPGSGRDVSDVVAAITEGPEPQQCPGRERIAVAVQARLFRRVG